jgi:hypothetical protein
MHQPGSSRVLRWASVVLLLGAAGVVVAAAWPVIHDKLPGRSSPAVPPTPHVAHLSPLRMQVAATGSVSGARLATVHGGTLWVLRADGKHAPVLARYSAHALKPIGHTIALRHANGAVTGLATGRTGVYVRNATGIARVDGSKLTQVPLSSVPRTLLLSLSGAVGFNRAWTTDGHSLYARNPGGAAPVKIPIPRPVGASRSTFVAAGAQPVVLDALWVAQAVGSGKHRMAQVQPLTPAGHIGGRPIRLGHGTAGLELVAAHRLWVVVSRSPSNVLYEINPVTGRVMGSMALPKHFLPVKGFATGRALWLAESSAGGSVVRVSLTSPTAS